jgi:hypothetical protein
MAVTHMIATKLTLDSFAVAVFMNKGAHLGICRNICGLKSFAFVTPAAGFI